jgi:nucleoid DNA-binding protein
MKRVAVKQVVQEFLDQVIVELGDGNRLEFRDFGVFEVKQRAPRIAQNPKTLERVPVPAKRTVKFKVGRRMREAMDHDEPKSGNIETKPVHASAAMRSEAQRDVVGSIRVHSTERKAETAGVR